MDQVRNGHMNDYVEAGDFENVKRLYNERGYVSVRALEIATNNDHYEIAKFIIDIMTEDQKKFFAQDVKNFEQKFYQ